MLERRKPRGQALVELALVMPLLLGIVAVLFQFGILLVTYLSLMHITRDVGRWLVVHPDTFDSAVRAHVQADLPSVISPSSVQMGAPNFGTYPGALFVELSMTCTTLTNNHCASRPQGSAQHVTLTYDASGRFILPSVFRLGPFFEVQMPGKIQSYDYWMMVEGG